MPRLRRQIAYFSALAVSLAAAASSAAAADFDYQDNAGFYTKYPDLACIDTGPLNPDDAAKYTGDSLEKIGNQAQNTVTRKKCYKDIGNAPEQITEIISGPEYLDRLYARLGSGPIPDGFHLGRVVMSIDGGLSTLADAGLVVPGVSTLDRLADQLWRGKYFDKGRMYLKNRITLSGFTFGFTPKDINDSGLKFPAKLYCGESLFDARRESIIIDYKFGAEDKPADLSTDANLDWVAGGKGLSVRDEIRMVKPGLYLGRAYVQGAFALYFILEHVAGSGTDPDPSEHDACWLGHQRQRQLGLKPSDFMNRWDTKVPPVAAN